MNSNEHPVRLRDLTLSDLQQTAAWNRDPELKNFTDSDLPGELELLQQWFIEQKKHSDYYIAAIETSDGTLIGDWELAHISSRRHEAELRIRIGVKNYWNRGYGSAALQLIMKECHERRHLDHLYLRVYSFNIRAQKCYLKNGFKAQGILHRNISDWKDIILMEHHLT